MTWADIANWETVGQIIVAVTGSTTLVALISPIAKFCGGQLADWLSTKRKSKADQQLTTHKGIIEHKIYVSKVRFDTEFMLYKELSQVFFDMLLTLNTMTPMLQTIVPSEAENKENYENTRNAAYVAQNTLHRCAPFIPQNFFDKYQELLDMSKLEIDRFRRKGNIHNKDTAQEEKTTTEEYKRPYDMKKGLQSLNNEIREYLQSLEVI